MGYILLYIRDGCDVAGNGQINHQLYLPFTIVQSVMWSRVIRITYNIQNLWIYLLHSGLKCTQGTDRQTKHTWSKWLLNNVNTEWQPNKFTQSDTEFNNHFSMLYSCYHEMLQAATLQNASDAPVLMLLIGKTPFAMTSSKQASAVYQLRISHTHCNTIAWAQCYVTQCCRDLSLLQVITSFMGWIGVLCSCPLHTAHGMEILLFATKVSDVHVGHGESLAAYLNHFYGN